MHIGLEVTNLRHARLGGAWRYTDRLSHALARMASSHRYSLLFFNSSVPWKRGPRPPVPSSPSMRLVDARFASNFLFTFMPMLVPGMSERLNVESFLGPVDVFHSMNGVVLPQRRGRRVVTVQDLTCLEFPQHHPWLRRRLFAAGVRRAVQAADAIIVPSFATRRDLLSRFPLAGDRVRVVPLAAGEHFVPLAERQVVPMLERLNLPYRGYVLFVGNIEPRKNLSALIAAYNLLRAETALRPFLVMAGGAGWQNHAIRTFARASPFSADIRFLGYVQDAEIPALMNGAAVFVYPSVAEGFGLPPLEAMACGTPVVTSNVSSLPEVVGDGGVLVNPSDPTALADAIARILEDESLRAGLREKGLSQARRFSWDETARLTLRVYESLAA